MVMTSPKYWQAGYRTRIRFLLVSDSRELTYHPQIQMRPNGDWSLSRSCGMNGETWDTPRWLNSVRLDSRTLISSSKTKLPQPLGLWNIDSHGLFCCGQLLKVHKSKRLLTSCSHFQEKSLRKLQLSTTQRRETRDPPRHTCALSSMFPTLPWLPRTWKRKKLNRLRVSEEKLSRYGEMPLSSSHPSIFIGPGGSS